MSGYTPASHESRARFIAGSIDLIQRRDGCTLAEAEETAIGEWERWMEWHNIRVRRGGVAEEPEWEYGYTSKWGTIAASSQADAETRAAEHTRGIAEHRESGDLKYHGKVVKRVAASKPGEWVPMKQEGAET